MQVKNTVMPLQHNLSAFQAYVCLKERAKAQDLFLLESLSGPDRALRKAILGIHPVLGLRVKNGQIELTGASQLVRWAGEVIQAVQARPVFEILRTLEKAFQVNYIGDFNFDYRFGFLGYIGYDAIQYIERIKQKIPDQTPLPDMVLMVYQAAVYVDFDTQTSYWIENEFSAMPTSARLSEYKSLLDQAPLPSDPYILQEAVTAPRHIEDSLTREEYCSAVNRALKHIALGDIYQIQLGHTLTIDSDVDPFVVYQRLRQQNPSPYMYYVEMGDIEIIGASPELCVNLRDHQVTIRPLAGTIRRGQTPAEEAALQETLRNDPKEKAEHLMLVDLARNDVSRVCKVNTLNVTELMVIEAYSHVFHLVSNVVGDLRADRDHYDVIAASFPAGTLTGSPKIRAIELIEEIETSRRGIYGGCLGYIDFRGNTEMAICIRTALHQEGRYFIRASAGVVVDSSPEKEWQETYAKLSSNYYAITGRELKDEDFAR